jgi:hypothetical protein
MLPIDPELISVKINSSPLTDCRERPFTSAAY